MATTVRLPGIIKHGSTEPASEIKNNLISFIPIILDNGAFLTCANKEKFHQRVDAKCFVDEDTRNGWLIVLIMSVYIGPFQERRRKRKKRYRCFIKVSLLYIQ